jgi:hypothetical protein
LREARSAAAINHPNVVTIHAVGEQAGMPYLVMECIPGQSLRQRIRSGPPLRPVQMLRISLQIAQGLEAAQQQVVIHRDIKPANIMLEDSIERVKITDFGLALAAAGAEDVTSTDQIVGTPEYMSPEQVRGDTLDHRSDLFSLGVVMYAMATGVSPFKGKQTIDTVRRVTDLEPPRLDAVDGSLPTGLADLVERLLKKDPAERPATATEVIEAIRLLLSQMGLYDSTESDPGRGKPGLVERSLLQAPEASSQIGRMGDQSQADDGTLAGLVRLAAGFLLVALALVVALGFWWRGTSSGGIQGLVSGGVVSEVAGNSAPERATVITVSSTGRADHRSLNQAIAYVTSPNTTIRIIDGGTYDGRIEIKNSPVHIGLTIEAGSPGQRPVLTAPGERNAVLTIDGTPGVTLRGIAVASSSNQFALSMGGFIPNVTIEDVRFTKREPVIEDQWSHVWVGAGARGDSEAPFQFLRCWFGPWMSGLVFQGNAGGLIGWAEVRECRFEVKTRQLELISYVRDVRLENNVFLNGETAIVLDNLSGASGEITIANNTFFGVRNWIAPSASDPELPGMRIEQNALIAVPDVDDEAGRLMRLAEGGWQFRDNYWESHEGSPTLLVKPQRALVVMSRDPSDPDFLRPSPNSVLVPKGGAGFIGALEP